MPVHFLKLNRRITSFPPLSSWAFSTYSTPARGSSRFAKRATMRPPPPPHGQGDSSERFARHVFAASILGLFSLAWASSDEANAPALRVLRLSRGQHPASNYLNHLPHGEGILGFRRGGGSAPAPRGRVPL